MQNSKETMSKDLTTETAGLGWIREDVDEKLVQARRGLEEFVDDSRDELNQVIQTLHQVRGALGVARIYGAALIAAHLEQLADALNRNAVSDRAAAADALMLGIVQLPAYLERLEKGEPDIPVSLLPLVNEIRSAQGQAAVSRMALLAPRLDFELGGEQKVPAGTGNPDLPALVAARRPIFHRGLLAWMRDKDSASGLQDMQAVIQGIAELTRTAPLRRLMDATAVLLHAIGAHSVEVVPTLKVVFGRIDRVLKAIMDEGEERAARGIPLELLKNVLYHLARADSADSSLLELRAEYHLDQVFAEAGDVLESSPGYAGADSGAFAAVGGALKQDLALITDRLESYVRGDRGDLTRLAGLAEPLGRLGDTLGMLELVELRDRLHPHIEEIRKSVDTQQEPHENVLMALAGDLLAIESALLDLSQVSATKLVEGGNGAVSALDMSQAEYRAHVQTTLDLVVLELARLREALSAYIEGGEANTVLLEVPVALRSLAGALAIVNQPRVSALIEGLGRYIERHAQGDRPAPESDEADALADLFGGIEYYLSYLLRPALGHDRALDTADQALLQLLGEETIEPAAAADPEEAVLAAGDVAGVTDSELIPDEATPDAPGDAETAESAPASESLIDPEILDVFLEEANEEVENIQAQCPAWRDQPESEEPLALLRRSFHTLKGSGRLVGASEIGEFAWSMENLLNRVIDGTVTAGQEVVGLVEEAARLLPELVARIGASGNSAPEVESLQERAFAMANGEALPASVGAGEISEEGLELSLGESLQTAPVETIDIEPPAEPPEALPVAALHEESALPVDSEVQQAIPVPLVPPEDQSLAEGHGLDSGAEVATGAAQGQGFEGELELEKEAEAQAESDLLNGNPAEVDDAPAEAEMPPASELPAPIELEATLFDIFRRETEEHLDVLQQYLERCKAAPAECDYSDDLKRSLHTLRGSADMAGVAPLAQVAGKLEHWVAARADKGQAVNASLLDLLERGHATMQSLLEVINRPGADMPHSEALLNDIAREVERLDQEPLERLEMASAESDEYDEELAAIFIEEARELIDLLEAAFVDWNADFADSQAVAQMQRGLHTMKGGARLASLSAIGDLTHAAESLLEGIVERRTTPDSGILELVRETLDALADQVEGLEQGIPLEAQPALIAQLEAVVRGADPEAAVAPPDREESTLEAEPENGEEGAEQDQEPVPTPAADAIVASDSPAEVDEQDDLQALDELEQLEESYSLPDSELLTDSELLSETGISEPSALPRGDGDLLSGIGEDSRIIQFPDSGNREESSQQKPHQPPPEEETEQAPSRDQVRVSAALLDGMVNNAGEMHIYGARIEQQNKLFGQNIEELFQTISRLQDQLRKLENETEAQILSGHERQHEGDLPAGFDPLEMDRYSMIQQLSRALSETTEDLSNIGTTLGEMTRDTETLLQQQARIHNDLQEGLLRTRMVPVGSRATRLQRLVRQTAQTLGKKAELVLSGEQGEIDRSILDKMIGPLEHMLRNAVAHGIESADERRKAGKPSLGRISLDVGREGSEVVLTVSDDGRGLDRDAIRRKAEGKGLIDPSVDISGEELDAFILEAGLSTSAGVSQVAGRGVGMDVVASEIKQLGGSLDIHSDPGKGARFVIRLPFTLAISEALLVAVGDEIFVVPHGSMDGISRIAKDELEACYRGEQEAFEFDGKDYRVRYLGDLLGLGPRQLPETARWLPILLVRSGEHRVALQVDRLLGNREVVVKSIGTQLSGIRWFSGGTILADGNVALILDMVALMRMETAQQTLPSAVAEEEAAEGIRVLVVDDSITVRKVTGRLLERHNMAVTTARDGVDALAMLQQEKPDVVLLDIEMPRMDGFELARHMQSSETLRDVPIIMITSRTGTKHRLHAVDLGVKRYLGKPYQEAELLENIYSVLAGVEA